MLKFALIVFYLFFYMTISVDNLEDTIPYTLVSLNMFYIAISSYYLLIALMTKRREIIAEREYP